MKHRFKKVEVICDDCNGSGEGRVDGSKCIHCKGWGVVIKDVDDEIYIV